MSVITGHFTAKYNGVDLLETESGWELREVHLVEDVLTDNGGDVPVNGVMRGTRVDVRGVYVDYNAIKAALYAVNPQGRGIQNVGALISDLAHALVLTPTPGTSAATDIGAGKSYSFYVAVILNDISTLLSTRHRKGPITFRCYPDLTKSGQIYDIINTPA